MKRLVLLACLLGYAVAGWAQQATGIAPDCPAQPFNFTATGVTAPFTNTGSGCTTWLVTYRTTGFSAISLELQYGLETSPGQSGTLATFPGTSAATDTSGGSFFAYGYEPFVAARLVSKTGTGRVVGNFMGWRPGPLGNSIAGGTITLSLEEIIDLLTTINSGVNNPGNVGIEAKATATGGSSGCAIVSAATNNATNCTAAATGFYGFEYLLNTTTTIYYLKRYNLATPPTCSSATGWVDSIPIPPAASAGQLGGLVGLGDGTIPNTGDFTTGFGYCIVAGSSSTNNDSAVTGIFGRIKLKS